VALSAIVGYVRAVKELGALSTTDDVLAGVDLSWTGDRAAALWAATEALIGERFA